ncbi:MAG TPA: hypothetical protein VM187_12645 [Niastella sp.]|nr:hypothetical protein [Niastella sp.]
MRKIPLNVSSISIILQPRQATPLASHQADIQHLASWSLINPKFIALISLTS